MNEIDHVRAALVKLQQDAERELTHALLEPTSESLDNWPPYERESAFMQTVKLGEGSDCNYDRPTVGVAYAHWYMPRRINEAFHFLLPELVKRKNSHLDLIDLGCGTGSTWWACRFISLAMGSLGIDPPSIEIHACDTSAPMIRLGQHLWGSINTQTNCNIQVSITLQSWTNLRDLPKEGVLFASFLFDQSDRVRVDELGKTLRRIVDGFDSTDVYLLGATNKRAITTSCVTAFLGGDEVWVVEDESHVQPVWSGGLTGIRQLRQQFANGCIGLTQRYSSSQVPVWSDNRVDYRHLKIQVNRKSRFHAGSSFILDEKQDIAASPDGRLTAILGAAGSGKSRVLVERLTRTILADCDKSNVCSSYLVTCFNKPVVHQLQKWFLERLEDGNDTRRRLRYNVKGESVEIWDVSRFDFDVDPDQTRTRPLQFMTNVTFATWDAVILRMFSNSEFRPSSESEIVMSRIIDHWGKAHSENQNWLNENTWVTPKFVLQELKRVIYGQSVTSLDEYLSVQRRGRPKEPQMRRDRREGLWKLLDDPLRKKLWVDRRIAALKEVQAGFSPPKFERIFLDECQDFVEADFKIISALINDPRNLVVSGDGTQALQTGPGYFRPGTVGGARWVTHELSGSYRLPIRICEAIEPIARAIQMLRRGQKDVGRVDGDENEDITLPHAVKSAVIGCRPIVIAPSDQQSFIDQFSRILNFVAPIVQSNEELVVTNADETNSTIGRLAKSAVALTKPTYRLENNSMLRIKGLERSCVLYSTKLDGTFAPGASPYEWVYTILTRTTNVLIINLSASTPPPICALIGRLRRDCLFFWDMAAEQRFDEFAALIGSESDPFK